MGKVIYIFKVFILLILSSGFTISADLNLDKIISKADKTNHIMLFLHKDNCRFCEKMIFNLEDTVISNEIDKGFIFVDINRDDDETILFRGKESINRDFLKEWGIDLYPTLIFLDEKGSLVYKTVGYRNPKKIIAILKYISSRAYNNMTFEEFEDELYTK